MINNEDSSLQNQVELIELNNLNDFDDEFQRLYMQAFPADERREWQQIIDLTENINHTIVQIYLKSKFVGFIIYWKFPEFIFIEHFAILPEERSKGYGFQALEKFIHEVLEPVVLEVEEPNSTVAIKRIRFYEKLYFRINSGIYFQPPYSVTKNAVKMLLMSFPKRLSETEFEKAKSRIYKAVYRV